MDAVARAISNDILDIIVMLFDLLIPGMFAFFGLKARKGFNWAFILGMVLYGLDGLLFLLVQDWLSIGFHIFALYGIYKGFSAKKQLLRIEQKITSEDNIDKTTVSL